MTSPRIVSSAFRVPDKVRFNNDPAFDWMTLHTSPTHNLFSGYSERRVLGQYEVLLDIMVPAAQQAIERANLKPGDIDMLMGIANMSQYYVPTELSGLHHILGLPTRCWVLPQMNTFSTFNSALLFADAMIRAGHARNILIAVGTNWTKHVSYRTPQSLSAGDGAGAVVVSADTGIGQWEVKAQRTLTDSSYYGSMYMQGARLEAYAPAADLSLVWGNPYFHITATGGQGFVEFGVKRTPKAVTKLLKKEGLTGADITLMSHQASTALTDPWCEVIKPAQYISTFTTFANMTDATIPVTFAWAQEKHMIEKDYLVFLEMGPDMHANALLLKRSEDA